MHLGGKGVHGDYNITMLEVDLSLHKFCLFLLLPFESLAHIYNDGFNQYSVDSVLNTNKYIQLKSDF